MMTKFPPKSKNDGELSKKDWRPVYSKQISEMFPKIYKNYKNNKEIESAMELMEVYNKEGAVIAEYPSIQIKEKNGDDYTIDPWSPTKVLWTSALNGLKHLAGDRGLRARIVYTPRKYTLIAYCHKLCEKGWTTASPEGVEQAFNVETI